MNEQTHDLLTAALQYAEKGFAVFPVVPREKVPFEPGGFHNATTDREKILNWWGTKYPNANIGIATGQVSGGLYVIDVDIDPEKGKFGNEELRKWEKENGEFPETMTSITGRGGMQYFFRDYYLHRDKTDILPGIDIRGDGGYVVAPPSIHPNGRAYEWELDHSPLDMDPAVMTSAVRHFFPREKTQTEKVERPLPEEITGGTRTDTMVKLIGALVSRGLSREAIEAAVRAENDVRCNPPLTEKELTGQILEAIDRGWIVERPYTDLAAPGSTAVRELPEPTSLGTLLADPPKLAPSLIDNVLRQGHKMILTGPSKAGKSFALMRLAIGIAEGMKWFGNQCRQGRVLYINMEIDEPSCVNRFNKIYENLGMDVDNHSGNIIVWTLRGYAMPLHKLCPWIIEKAQRDFAAIIIDPLYKVMDGDENSNSDISSMVGQFDKIAQETGASVIYAHHFAKGNAGDRKAIDRASGAGVFARDPDAILTMTQLVQSEEENQKHTAWRIEYTLREFPNKEDYNVWWEYPEHVPDYYGTLRNAKVESSLTQNSQRAQDASEQKKKERYPKVRKIADAVMREDQTFTLPDFKKAYIETYGESVEDKTYRRWLRDAGYYDISTGNSRTPAVWKFGGIIRES